MWLDQILSRVPKIINPQAHEKATCRCRDLRTSVAASSKARLRSCLAGHLVHMAVAAQVANLERTTVRACGSTTMAPAKLCPQSQLPTHVLAPMWPVVGYLMGGRLANLCPQRESRDGPVRKEYILKIQRAGDS